MRVLVTHPGKFGDLLWALPTVRAIAEAAGEPVDFLVSERYSPILELLRAQPYIGQALMDPDWRVEDTAPMSPRTPPVHDVWGRTFLHVIHLGYKRWPQLPLPLEAYWTAAGELGDKLPLPGVDLSKPWIEAPSPDRRRPVVVGFTDEWAELKAGLTQTLLVNFPAEVAVLAPPDYGSSRLGKEFGLFPIYPADWVGAAELIAGAEIFVGCLSSLAVLAAALGKPRVLIEPNPHRHHEIFQHWDQELVLGNDGKPTFDARALVAAVQAKLKEVRECR